MNTQIPFCNCHMVFSKNAIILVIFIILEILVITISLMTHNLIGLGIGSGVVALGISTYIVVFRKPIPEERVPLIVDFVY